MVKAASPYGIIAAAGPAPLTVAEELRASGHDVVVIGLKSITDADFSGFEVHHHRLGAVSAIINSLKTAGVCQVILAGQFKRPKMAAVMPDMRGAKILSRALSVGDDEALQIVKDEFAQDGITVVDIADILQQDFAQHGVMAGQHPDQDQRDAIGLGAAYLKAAGGFDLGQSCVVEARRIIAVEAAEGTDAMLDRAAEWHDPDLAPVVMVKMLKSGQDRALDPPGIGVETIKRASKAGVSVIAIEAGGVMMIDPEATIKTANDLGVGLFGFKPE